MDDIPAQSPVVPVVLPVVPPQEEHSPLNVEYEQPKTWYGRIFDYSSWFVLFFLAPFTVAIFLSQNSIPGDLMYPIKLGLENLVLAGASVHPSTRAMFHTNVSSRRFAEAEALLVTRADTTGLATFILQVEEAQIAVNNVSDPVEKERLQEELVAKITEYETQLVEVQAKAQENVAIATVPQIQTQEQQSQTQQVPQSTATPTPSYTPTPTFTPTPSPTPKNATAETSTQNTPTPTPLPTNTPVPTVTPTPFVIMPPVTPQKEEKKQQIDNAINETKEDLERIKKEIEEKKKKEREERLRERLQKEEEKRQKQEEKGQARQERQEKREEASDKKGNVENHD